MAGFHGWIHAAISSGESGARVWMSDTLLARHLGPDLGRSLDIF